MATDQKFYANGKLLLTGEYFVLDGAKALAVPTRFGQSLEIVATKPDEAVLHWQSEDERSQVWFSAEFALPDLTLVRASDAVVGQTLSDILQLARQHNPDFLQQQQSLSVTTRLTFPRQWGLGTSSTLVATIAEWAGIDPFQLQFATFGGSGYDIACAKAERPIFYKKIDGQPQVEASSFAPAFIENLYFVFLGKKQNSRAGIKRYRKQVAQMGVLSTNVTAMTNAFAQAETLEELEQVIETHEAFIAQHLQLPRAKALYFRDYWGQVKSLGAWGGDFVLVTNNRSEAETRHYFNEKGYEVFFRYKQLILHERSK